MLLDIIKKDLEEIGGDFYNVDKDELVFSLAEGIINYYASDLKSDDISLDKFKEAFKELLDNNYAHVSSEGGGEGGAEYCESVFKYRDKYYKVYYYYYSHQGYETKDIHETICEVTPKQKVITVYE